MAPPTYNSSKHHIGLSDGTNYGFMVQGYSMELQREGKGAAEFGGQSDLIGQTPALSRWTQDDFTGGAFGYVWGRDDAMFADCVGFMPDMQGRALISVPPMFQKAAYDPDTQSGFTSDTPRNLFMVGASIYAVFTHGILRYRIDTDATSWKSAPTNSTYVMAQFDPNDSKIWAVCNSSVVDDRPFIERIKTDLTSPTYDSEYVGPRTTENLNAYGLALWANKIIVQIGRKLWAGVPPAAIDPVEAGEITWTAVGRLPGRWRDHVEYNNMVYILQNDGANSPSFRSYISGYDGDAIYPIAVLPHSFMGKCITEYGGRVFIGGTGTDVNGGEHYAELYEMTGTSVRLVRSFSPETRRGLLSSGDWPNTIDDLIVHEGLLWFCQKGKRMACYDITSDAFYGGSEIMSNTDLNFPRLTGGRGRLWAWGVDDSDDTKHGIWRIAQPADTATVAGWKPTLVTSDFAYEPGMKKRWSEIKVMTRYGKVDSLEYSLDAGTTWTALTESYVDTYAPIYYCTASLQAITPSEHIRFRVKLTSTGESGDAITYHRELIAYTVSFHMLDTGKKTWSMTIINAEEVETLDAELSEATVQAQDTTDIDTEIEGWAVNRTPLTLTDIDGDTANVQITSFRKTLPVMGPGPSGEAHPECFYNVILTEV